MLQLLKSTVKFLVDLPFKKIPIYYIPLSLGLYYATRETIMVATSTWLYNQLEEETERREKEKMAQQDINTFEEISDIDADGSVTESDFNENQLSEKDNDSVEKDNDSVEKDNDSIDDDNKSFDKESIVEDDKSNSDISISDDNESFNNSIDEILEEVISNSLVDKELETSSSWTNWFWSNTKDKLE